MDNSISSPWCWQVIATRPPGSARRDWGEFPVGDTSCRRCQAACFLFDKFRPCLIADSSQLVVGPSFGNLWRSKRGQLEPAYGAARAAFAAPCLVVSFVCCPRISVSLSSLSTPASQAFPRHRSWCRLQTTDSSVGGMRLRRHVINSHKGNTMRGA